MILSFKNQFPSKIITGTKIHTIREDKPGRWIPGRKIHFATGVKTKNYRCFYESECKAIQSIKIEYFWSEYESSMNDLRVWIDGRLFYKVEGNFIEGSEQMEQLAKNDGFDSVDDFFLWFSKDFTGKIIHWTDLRY